MPSDSGLFKWRISLSLSLSLSLTLPLSLSFFPWKQTLSPFRHFFFGLIRSNQGCSLNREKRLQSLAGILFYNFSGLRERAWILTKQSKHSSLCTCLRAWTLRLSLLLQDGASLSQSHWWRINVLYAPNPQTHTYALRYMNAGSEPLHCRQMMFSCRDLQLWCPPCWSLLVLAVVSSSKSATPVLCSSVQVLPPLPPALLLFCDFRVCFPGICC